MKAGEFTAVQPQPQTQKAAPPDGGAAFCVSSLCLRLRLPAPPKPVAPSRRPHAKKPPGLSPDGLRPKGGRLLVGMKQGMQLLTQGRRSAEECNLVAQRDHEGLLKGEAP